MKKYIAVILILIITGTVRAEEPTEIDFEKDTFSAQSEQFSAFVGKWHIDKDDNNLVYAVDGRKWERGLMAEGIAQKAKALYGKRYAEFLDNLDAYKYFPLSICKDCKNLKNGVIEVKFKAISGRIDQAAGIAFNIQPNGDYLVIRANPLEQNIVLFKMEKGHRSSEQWIRGIPHKSGKWYSMKVILRDNLIEGYMDNKKYISYEYKENLDGKIGLWSKADSYVFFDNFTFQSNTE